MKDILENINLEKTTDLINEVVGKKSDENKKHNDKVKQEIDEVFKKDQNFFDSDFFNQILKAFNEISVQPGNKKQLVSMLRNIGIKEELGLDANEQVQSLGGLWPFKVFEGVLKTKISNMTDIYKPESMLESVILNPNTQEDIYMALLEDEKARQLIYDKITLNSYIRRQWCEKLPNHLLSKTFKNIEKLKDWEDNRGNNLGYYLILFRKNLPKTYLQTILRLNKKWFDRKNHKGIELMDIIKPIADKNSVVLLEKGLMKRTLKEEGLVKRKTKSSKRSRAM